MPIKVFLATYELRLHPKGNPDQHLSFGNVSGSRSLVDILEEFFEMLRRDHAQDEENQFLHGAEHIERDNDTICGLLRSGDYGYTTNLVNIHTLTQSHQRSVDEAEMYPYYFLVHAPPGEDYGVLVVQRIGARGIFTVFQHRLHEYLSSRHDVILELREHIPAEVMNYLRSGSLKRVVFNQYQIPKDRADLIGWDVEELEGVADVKIIVTARGRFNLPVPDILQQQYTRLLTTRQPVSLGENGDIDVVVSYAGKQRTVKFSRPDKIAPYVDVTRDLRIVDGHPTFETIDASARGLLQGILVEMGAQHVV